MTLRAVCPPLALAGGVLLALAGAPAGAAGYKQIYAFQGGGDGAYPQAGMIVVGGVLYGTTVAGGAPPCGDFDCGTVFRATALGAEKRLHSFRPATDGHEPGAALLAVGNVLYGTTQYGGADGEGTVFAMSKTGVENWLYSFKSGSDGVAPLTALIDVGGTLYGTTYAGGGIACDYAGCGTVFSITPQGSEVVVYSFQGGSDGIGPTGLIDVAGTLYGTTSDGGANLYGTLFSLTATGTEKVLHAFGAAGDGARPLAGVIRVGNALYGTTYGGGSGAGSVFKATLAGKVAVIYPFQGGNDGATPDAGLIDVGGTLYGTTVHGGGSGCNGTGCGTVFSVTPGGAETVLYSFQGGDDGAYPEGTLVAIGGTLYGTTSGGGAKGDGTVFSITP